MMRRFILLIAAITYWGLTGFAVADVRFTAKNFSGTKSGDLQPRRVHDIIEDHRGIIYVADDSGVLEYDGLQWRLITLPQGAVGRALATDQKGRVYVGGDGQIGYLSPDLNGTMAFVSLTELIPKAQLHHLKGHMTILAKGNEIAFLTDRLLIYLKDRQVHLVESDSFFSSGAVASETLYLVDENRGLLRYTGKELVPVSGGSFFAATALTVTNEGKILAASMSEGLLELDTTQTPVTLKTFAKQDKSTISGTTMTRIRTMGPLILTGTIGKGLLIYDQARQEPLAIAGTFLGDLGKDIFALATDRHQRVWVGTQTGVWALTPSTAVAVKEETKAQDSGFFAYIRSCVSMKDQEVVFGGAFFQELGGVQTLEASKLNRPKLSHKQNSLRFSYASSELAQAEDIQFQTFLEGQDEQWTEWSNRTYREFTNLMWKNYVFKVRAKRPDGTISKDASFELSILPPWYERYWFYLIQLLILALLLCFVIYLKGWTKRFQTTEKLNGVIVGTIWGYSFSKVGVQGMVWAMSGGAAFLAIIMNAFMGIFLKPMQKKLEARMIEFEDRMIEKFQPEIAKEKQRLKRVAELKKKPRHARSHSKAKFKAIKQGPLHKTGPALPPRSQRLRNQRKAA